MDLGLLGVALGVLGIFVSVAMGVWQVLSEQARRRRRKAKKRKAELKAARKRISDLEARSVLRHDQSSVNGKNARPWNL